MLYALPGREIGLHLLFASGFCAWVVRNAACVSRPRHRCACVVSRMRNRLAFVFGECYVRLDLCVPCLQSSVCGPAYVTCACSVCLLAARRVWQLRLLVASPGRKLHQHDVFASVHCGLPVARCGCVSRLNQSPASGSCIRLVRVLTAKHGSHVLGA